MPTVVRRPMRADPRILDTDRAFARGPARAKFSLIASPSARGQAEDELTPQHDDRVRHRALRGAGRDLAFKPWVGLFGPEMRG